MDMTFGSGGHTKTLLASKADIKVIALDRDPVAYEKAVQLAQETDFRVLPLLGRFSDAPDLLKKIGIRPGQLSGIIMDVGPSVEQLEDASRGFNINLEGPLDMRMDGNRLPGMPTAADVINTLETDSLTKIFRIYGENKVARKLAQAIVDARFMMMSIKSTIQLSQLVSSIQGGELRLDVQGRPNSAATSVFQALRIFVNNELNEISYAMTKMREFLVFDPKVQQVNKVGKDMVDETGIAGGVMAILCSNRLEDMIVKDHVLLRKHEEDGDPYTQRPINYLETPTEKEMERLVDRKWLPLEKFVLFPGEEEILTNPTGKTTRLRCAMRRL
jgi:16S rRNA (cytosine(1402)-N(4))-methyltransferase